MSVSLFHPDFEAARAAMVLSQLFPSGVLSGRVLDAYRAIPREVFVPRELQSLSYSDSDLTLGEGRVLLSPLLHGRMVEAAGIGPGDRVLDIGGGNGYSAAVLSRLCAFVTALEERADLLKQAEGHWISLGLSSILPVVGSHACGAAGHGPYHVILINGAVPFVPFSLLDQLRVGGRLVCVLTPPHSFVGQIVCLKKREGGEVGRRVIADVLHEGYLSGFSSVSDFSF